MLYYEAYRRWQLAAFRRAEILHQEKEFDICHQLTFIGYREPGYLWKLGTPFVWGPISGAENFPGAFFRSFRFREIFRPLSREIGNRVQMAFPGRIRQAAQKARKIFVVSEAERRLLASWGCVGEPLLETGTNAVADVPLRWRETREPLRILWSGLFTPRKALPLLFRAIARMGPNIPIQLEIMGDGPMEYIWRAEAEKLQLGTVIWHGRKAHADALKLMQQAHLLAHTGLREGTPHVVLEALSLGLPVICHDAGGMATAITETCGIKIPLLDPETSIAGFATALRRFLDDPTLLAKMSAGAKDRAVALSWDAIADRLGTSYQKIGTTSAQLIASSGDL